MPLDIWVDPQAGNDANSGGSPAFAKRTFMAGLGAVFGGTLHLLPGQHTVPNGSGANLSDNGLLIQGEGAAGTIYFRAGPSDVSGNLGFRLTQGSKVTFRNLLLQEYAQVFYAVGIPGETGEVLLEDCAMTGGLRSKSAVFSASNCTLNASLIRCTVLGYERPFVTSMGTGSLLFIRVARQVLYASAAIRFRDEGNGFSPGTVSFVDSDWNSYAEVGGETPKPPIELNSIYRQPDFAPRLNPTTPYGRIITTTQQRPRPREVVLTALGNDSPPKVSLREVVVTGEGRGDLPPPAGMIREVAIAGLNAQETPPAVMSRETMLTAQAGTDLVPPVLLRDVGMTVQVTDVPPPILLSELSITVDDPRITHVAPDQPLGPTDPSQTLGRMRHGKFFSAGKLRRVKKDNRRTP